MAKKKELVVVPEIIRDSKNKLWTTSLDIAEKFKKKHKNVLQSIENLGCSEEFKRLNFQPLSRTIRGGTQDYFMISSGGFAFLVLGFTGKKIDEWKEKYITAFEKMREELERIQQYNARQTERRGQLEWQQARAEGKIIRREETDAIKRFVEYAEAHGSKHARMYYTNLTAMVNKIFFGIKKGQLKGKNAREFMNKDQLFHAAIGDRIIYDTTYEVVDGEVEYHEVTPRTEEKLVALVPVLKPEPILIEGLNLIEDKR